MPRRINLWLGRHLWAQAVMVFVILAVLGRLFQPGRPVAGTVLKAAAMTAVCVGFLAARRRRERALAGTSDDRALQALGVKLLDGTVPRDPQERQAMRRLVAHGLDQLHRTRWIAWALAGMFLVLAVLAAVLGSPAGALVPLALAVATGPWMLWVRRRQARRLERMRDLLEETEREPAGAGARG